MVWCAPLRGNAVNVLVVFGYCTIHSFGEEVPQVFGIIILSVFGSPRVPRSMCRMQVRDWLKAKPGSARVMEEIKKRKAVQSLRVGIIDASVAELKVVNG